MRILTNKLLKMFLVLKYMKLIYTFIVIANVKIVLNVYK
jgi:hypothetical protein